MRVATRDDTRTGRELDSVFPEYLMRYEPLTTEQEQELGRRIAAGDLEARDKILLHNMRFVRDCCTTLAGAGLDIRDVAGAAILGATEAANRFRANGNKFISYASHYIFTWIAREKIRMEKPVRLPSHTSYSGAYELRKMINAAEARGDILSDADLRATGATDATIHIARTMMANPKELDAPVGIDGAVLADFFISDEPLPDEPAVTASESEYLERLLAVLDDRARDIVRRGFGLKPHLGQWNLREIGDHWGLSRERIRQILEYALWRLQIEAGMSKWGTPTDRVARLMQEAQKRNGKA